MANGEVVENAAESIFEVDPLTGDIIDKLLVKGPLPGEVSCAANKKLSAKYYGIPPQPNVPDQLTYASAPR